MDRVTQRHIDLELSRLNNMMGLPEETYHDGEYLIGNIHTYDNNIVQTMNASHGIATLSYCKTKRETWEKLRAMHEAVRLFRMKRGM